MNQIAADTTPPSPDSVNVGNHPCFNPDACRNFGRIHLPVAPNCNIQCNYCNRDFDCVNESRPGVTSTVLSPEQALVYLETVMAQRGDIAVVGIAGPGDPFANPRETMETFRLVRDRFPEMILCLSTNGLGLTEDYVRQLAELKVSHVTLTINAVDPEVGQHIYSWARYKKRMYRKREAAELMLERQLEALKWIKAYGMIAKVNGIILPEINDRHLAVVAEKVSELGADLMNCIPLLPTRDTAFSELAEPDRKMRLRVQQACGTYMDQMEHCARCRADAVGKLHEPMEGDLLALIQSCARLPLRAGEVRPYVAVATREGMLVNQHLGEAASLMIFAMPDDAGDQGGPTVGGFVQMEVRSMPPPGGGRERWETLGRELSDCRAVLVSAVGGAPREVLTTSGVEVIEMDGMIEAGLNHVFLGEARPRGRGFVACGVSCGGDGSGCG